MEVMRLRTELAEQEAAAELIMQGMAATSIQAAMRGRLARKYLASARHAAVRIQSVFRRHVAQVHVDALRIERAVMDASCTKMQAAFRGLVARRRAAVERAAVVRVQSAIRGYSVRAEFNTMRAERITQINATILVQSTARGFLARRMLARKNAAAHTVQCAVRGYLARSRLAQLRAEHAMRVAGALQMQALARGYLARMQVARMRAELAVARAAEAQAIARDAAALSIQAALRGWHMRQRFGIARTAAITIQRRIRGMLGRVYASKLRKMMEQKARIAAAAAVTQPAEKRLCARTTWALSVLASSQELAHLGEACDALVVCCTDGGAVCQSLVAGNGGVEHLLRYVRSCGRSDAHVALLTKCLSVLRSCAVQGAPSAAHIARARGCVSVLLEQMQACRDKPDVFDAACDVLVLLAQDPETRTAAFSPTETPTSVAATPARAVAGGYDAETIKRLALMHGILSKRHAADSQWLSRMSGARSARGAAAAEAAKLKLTVCAKSIARLEAVLDALGVDASAREMLATPAMPAAHRFTPLTTVKTAAPMSTLRRRRTPNRDGLGG